MMRTSGPRAPSGFEKAIGLYLRGAKMIDSSDIGLKALYSLP